MSGLSIGDRVRVRSAFSVWDGREGVVEEFQSESEFPVRVRMPNFRGNGTRVLAYGFDELVKVGVQYDQQRGSVEGGALVQFVALLSAFTAGLAAILNDRALWGPALIVLVVACLCAFAWGRRRGARAAALALAYAMKKLGNGVRVRDAMKFLTRPQRKAAAYRPRGEADVALLMVVFALGLLAAAAFGPPSSSALTAPSSCSSSADGGTR